MTIRCCVLDQVLPKKVVFTLGAPSNGTCSVCAGFAGTYVLDIIPPGDCNQYMLETTSSGCWNILITLGVSESVASPGKLHFIVSFARFDSTRAYIYSGDADDFSCVTLTCENPTATPFCTFPSTATIEPGELWPITD